MAQRRLCSLLLLASACSSPDARLSAASQSDPACHAELHAGLDALRSELGLAIEVDDEAVDTLASSGELERSHVRDGTRYGATFGFSFADAGCVLRLFALTTSTGGSTTTRYADHGWVRLDACHCVEAP
jgi:hypothetical protein